MNFNQLIIMYRAKMLLICFFISIKAHSQFYQPTIITACDACHPIHVMAHDLDADNFNDIVVTTEEGLVAWYKNQDGASFSDQLIITIDVAGISSLSGGDMDSDSDTDLIISSNSGSLLLYLNEGPGIFTTTQTIDEDLERILEIFTTDINGDGRLDILGLSNSSIFWYEQLEDITFSEKKDIYDIPIQGNRDLALADIDNDGDIDLITVIDYGRSVLLFTNEGKGTFEKISIIGSTQDINSIFLGDFNGDGLTDILGTNDDNVALSINEGNMTFSSFANIANNTTRNDKIAHAMDADADGDLDIVDNYPFSARGISWIENDGAGNFTVEGGYPSENVISPASNSPINLVTVDINNDNLQDLIYCDTRLNMTGFYKNIGNGDFGEGIITKGLPEVSDLKAFDLDQDGDLDLISAADHAFKISWFENLNDSEGFKERLIAISYHAGDFLEIDDFDNDGDPDIMSSTFTFGNGGITLFENQGGANAFIEKPLLNAANGLSHISSGDLDNDGDLDVLYTKRYQGELIGWQKNLGNNFFSEPQTIDNINDVSGAKQYDLNADGLNDIIYTSEDSSTVAWYENKGNENFEIHYIDQNADRPTWPYIVDLDLDGDPDIICRSLRSGKLAWYENTGNNNFSSAKNILSGPVGLSDVQVDDVDGDSDNDIIISYLNGTQKVAWLENIGRNEFDLHDIHLTNSGVRRIQVADFDGDSDFDIVAALPSLQALYLYENLSNEAQISGEIYWDENNNGTKDEVEFNIPNINIQIEPKALGTFTNEDGHYRFYVLKDSTYHLHLNLNSCWKINSESILQNIVVTEDTLNFNIGLSLIGDKENSIANLSSANTRCGFTVPFWLSIENNGCKKINGLYGMVLSPLLSFIEADAEPYEVRGDTLLWNYNDLISSSVDKVKFYCEVAGPDQLGEIITMPVLSYIQQVDGNFELSNIREFQSEIRCAYDPNDKLSTPNRLTDPEEAYDKNYTLYEESIEYTIRFQNTGNDTAFTIEIIDQLDPNFDFNSFTPIESSAPYEVEINKAGLVKFIFRNILLVDSTTNEPLSHGYVRYRILSKSDIQEETDVLNRAQIIFDFNPPIITNWTINTMVSALPTTTNVWNIKDNYEVDIFPNPVRNTLSIRLPDHLIGKHIFEAYSIKGKRIIASELDSKTTELNIMNWDNGFYFIRILSRDGAMVYSGKIFRVR